MSKVGRPKADNPRNKTISETRVTKEEYWMVTLKSALYAGGSTAKLVRDAIEVYEGEIREEQTCGSCDSGIMTLKRGEHSFYFNVGSRDYEIVVAGVPWYHCDCGEVEGDLIVSAAIEDTLSEMIVECLRYNSPVPSRINLSDLLAGKSLKQLAPA